MIHRLTDLRHPSLRQPFGAVEVNDLPFEVDDDGLYRVVLEQREIKFIALGQFLGHVPQPGHLLFDSPVYLLLDGFVSITVGPPPDRTAGRFCDRNAVYPSPDQIVPGALTDHPGSRSLVFGVGNHDDRDIRVADEYLPERIRT